MSKSLLVAHGVQPKPSDISVLTPTAPIHLPARRAGLQEQEGRMLSRPKPGESEADLLHFQNQFLAARASPAVKIVKKADKRKGQEGSTDAERPPLQDCKDVVMLDDFPDTLPALTPAPPKKSKIKSACVRFEDEDPEERLESHDQHITAVFSKIIERDTSAVAVTMPVPTGDPFPRTFHRSEIKSERPCLITGEGLGSQKSEQEAQAIHRENLEKLQSMSEEEILQEQEKLLAQLDSSLVAFLKSRRGGNEGQKKELKMEPNRVEEFVGSLPVAQHGVGSCLSTEESGLEESVRKEENMKVEITDWIDVGLP
ncbi:rna polymerase ii-associated protein 1 isoform x1 [Limosa lapponica baueri]|uniref:Rna polymerase ii-associated protein 1 isoform x1 n=1 Tax=Limosa lapponica baueri TaxID=1758121 RepID=A0A2I0TXD8_LIMLA|nr:rna polymerase ii-associated protein 1 isoform x1 [Limosa lapponica baueri]